MIQALSDFYFCFHSLCRLGADSVGTATFRPSVTPFHTLLEHTSGPAEPVFGLAQHSNMEKDILWCVGSGLEICSASSGLLWVLFLFFCSILTSVEWGQTWCIFLNIFFSKRRSRSCRVQSGNSWFTDCSYCTPHVGTTKATAVPDIYPQSKWEKFISQCGTSTLCQ